MSYRYIQEPDSFYDNNRLSNFYLYIRRKLGMPLQQISPSFKSRRSLEEWYSTVGFDEPIKGRRMLSATLWLVKNKRK